MGVAGLATLAMAAFGAVACTAAPAATDSRIGQRNDDGSLVVGAGVAEGRPWTATAKISEHALCLSFVEAGTTQQFGCVPLANIRDADISFAAGVSGTDRVGGSTGEEARFVEVVAGGVMSRLPVISLRPLGLAAAAYGVLLPASPPMTEVRLLDGGGNVLERGAP